MAKYSSLLLTLLLFPFCKTAQNANITPTNTSGAVSLLASNANKNGEWLKAAQMYEQLYLQEPNNEGFNYEAGTNYLKANYPLKALAILTSFDRNKEDKTIEFNGRIARIAKAYYQVGAYQKIEEIIKNYKYPKMYRGLAREYLKALIQLQKEAKLSASFETYQQNGIYDDKGKSTNMGFLYRAICNELLLVDNADLLQDYAKKYHTWAMLRQEKDKRNLAIATFYQQDFGQAFRLLKIAISIEKSPRHRMELLGLLGICYAKNGDTKKALEQIETIRAFEDLPNRHDTFGAKFYHRARIEVALNQKENAIISLENALLAKAEFWSNRFNEDGFMRDLFSQENFKKLIIPVN